jgi:arylsulfatase A-like enzyme
MDWTATLLDLGGARPDPKHPLDGSSLSGYLLDGAPHRQRDLFWRMQDQGALRRGRMKYVQMEADTHLYDLGADVHQQADLASERPEELAAMRRAWAAIDATLLPYT